VLGFRPTPAISHSSLLAYRIVRNARDRKTGENPFAPFGEPETGLTGRSYFAIVYRTITN
jgi:hypothetical protein